MIQSTRRMASRLQAWGPCRLLIGEQRRMYDYKVRFVDDDLLDGRDWAMCRRDGATVLCVRRSARTLPDAEMERVLEAAWAGYRALVESISAA